MKTLSTILATLLTTTAWAQVPAPQFTVEVSEMGNAQQIVEGAEVTASDGGPLKIGGERDEAIMHLYARCTTEARTAFEDYLLRYQDLVAAGTPPTNWRVTVRGWDPVSKQPISYVSDQYEVSSVAEFRTLLTSPPGGCVLDLVLRKNRYLSMQTGRTRTTPNTSFGTLVRLTDPSYPNLTPAETTWEKRDGLRKRKTLLGDPRGEDVVSASPLALEDSSEGFFLDESTRFLIEVGLSLPQDLVLKTNSPSAPPSKAGVNCERARLKTYQPPFLYRTGQWDPIILDMNGDGRAKRIKRKLQIEAERCSGGF